MSPLLWTLVRPHLIVLSVKDRMVVYASGLEYELTMTPEEVGELLGLSDEAIRAQCRQGVIPTMPRVDLPGASWRIPTARLFEQLGVPHKLRATRRPPATEKRDHDK